MWGRTGRTDAIDTRLVNEVMTGTGKIARWMIRTMGLTAAGQYVANSSGIRIWNGIGCWRVLGDQWGLGRRGLTRARRIMTRTGMECRTCGKWRWGEPGVADNNGAAMNDGYTNLESYLNEAAAWPASTPLIFGNKNATSRYAEIGNWQTAFTSPPKATPHRSTPHRHRRCRRAARRNAEGGQREPGRRRPLRLPPVGSMSPRTF